MASSSVCRQMDSGAHSRTRRPASPRRAPSAKNREGALPIEPHHAVPIKLVTLDSCAVRDGHAAQLASAAVAVLLVEDCILDVLGVAGR